MRINITVFLLILFSNSSSIAPFHNPVNLIQTLTAVTTNEYDVVIVGSEPEGIMAAVAAAREGQKTLLVDKKTIVGGLYTLGKLNMIDINWAPAKAEAKAKESINKGLFLEFFEKINNRTSFDVKQAQLVFEEMLHNEENITVQLGAQSIEPLMVNKHVEALHYKNENGVVKKVVGKQYIDATPNADFAQLAGANFTIGQEDFRNKQKMMAVTLVFELSGIHWERVQDYLNNDEDAYTGADDFSAWGYGKEMEQYVPTQKNVRIRALNIGKQNNGHVLINAFQILGVNGLSAAELQEAKKIAVSELPRVINFLRGNLIGFENVKSVGIADEFYVRETRHLDAEYMLTVDDVLETRDFNDRIAFGSYPVDIQATMMDEGDIIVGKPIQYAIPFRSIVPKGFDNLLVASRSAGYKSLAHGSARTVPVGMTVGQAAGIAAAYANQERVDFQKLVDNEGLPHIRNIQAKLNRNGANLYPMPQYENPIVNHWAYEGVKFLRGHGLIEAGYDNEYEMDKTLSREKFIKYIQQIAQFSRLTAPIDFPFPEDDQPIKKEEFIRFFHANAVPLDSLSSSTLERLQNQATITRAIACMAIKEFFDYFTHNSLSSSSSTKAISRERELTLAIDASYSSAVAF
ncbi:MAG TPA: FAD-dependent oxidoreductase [Bacillus bacterium]|nr:FAD-dependent oxidoreductase [Bacillus sp. (in: firmicutes)]